MSRRQRYQKDPPPKRKPIPKEQCEKGWHCSEILKNRCEYNHDLNDRKIAEKISKIFEYQDTIIVLDISDQRQTPICLLDPSLPITIVNQRQVNMEIQRYYEALLVNEQRPYQIALKVQKQIGSYGHWETEERILTKYYPKEYELEKGQKETKDGEIKINGEMKKVIRGHQGKKYYLEKVNKRCKYPLLNGCKIQYFTNGYDIGLTKIIYPHEIRLSGIIQIDSNSQFYFISRNQEYDDMNPHTIPIQLAEKLVQFKYLFPYSFLKCEPISLEKQNKINAILKQFLVKGRFKAWPHHSRYPIIELIDQINVRNFKSLKDGIIYEAGISMTPFDKKQKEESQKIVKKFKIKDYESNRKFLDKYIYTVDGKSTKCHDDALYIEDLQNGGFFVQIHIADVAALIREEDDLNKRLKKRDETIYIKNYHQPMIYQSLKNLLSLKAGQEKLAFTLAFEITKDGFINYNSVKFSKNTIVVEKNLSHEKLDAEVEQYPQLMKLNALFDRSKLVDNNYILESETASEVALNRLIFVSSIIPTYLLEVNIERAKLYKESFDQYLKKMIEDRKKDMEEWEKILDNINHLKLQQGKINKDIKNIQKKVDNQINKQKQIIMKRIKNEQKQLKNKQTKQKQVKKSKKLRIIGSLTQQDQDLESFQTEQSQKDINELTLELAEDVKKMQEIEIQEQKDIAVKQEKELKLKQKRTKALKNVNVSDLQSSQSESQSESSKSSGQELNNEQFRFNAAVNGQKFLEKIFKNPLFNIDIKWVSLDEVNRAFRTILSKDKGKLYQQYFKRLQIINRQHFNYIIKMEQKKRKEKEKEYQQQDIDNTIREPQRKNKRKFRRIDNLEEQEQSQTTTNQKRKVEERQQKKSQRTIIKQQKEEPKREFQIKEESKAELQKQIQKKQDFAPKKAIAETKKKTQKVQKRQKPHNKEKQESEKEKNTQPQKQYKNPEKTNTLNKLVANLKIYMENQRQKYIQKYAKQFEKDKTLNSLDLSFNDKDNQMIGELDQKEFQRQKKNRLRVILKQNVKTRIKQQNRKAHRQKKQTLKQSQQQKSQNQNLEIIIDPKIKQELIVKLELKKDYYIRKYQKLLLEKQKFEYSQDEEWEELQLKVKDQYMNINKKYILNLLKTTFKHPVAKESNKKRMQRKEKKEAQKLEKEAQKKNKTKKEHRNTSQINKNQGQQQNIKENKECQSKNSFQQKLQQSKDHINQQNPPQNIGNKEQVKTESLQSLIQNKPENHENIITSNTSQPKKQGTNQEIGKNLTKRALKKRIQQQLLPFSKQINQKYNKEKQELKNKAEGIKSSIKIEKQSLYNNLQTANQQYNLLTLLTQQESENSKKKKSKKQKKKAEKNQKKEQKDHKASILTQFIENFKDYAYYADFKFKQMKLEELDEYLSKIFKIRTICEDNLASLTAVNKEASKKGQYEEKILKWNNPIRSYESLTVMRLIKSYKWLFEGQIYPSDIVRYYSDIKEIEKKLIELEDYRVDKLQRGEMKKNVKEANRQISKLEFYNLLKRDQGAVFTFLNIGSPCPEKVKFVFHPILEEIQVDNLEFKQEIYKEVKGKVKIVRDFPLKLTVVLQKS